jgi:hypothetical protein
LKKVPVNSVFSTCGKESSPNLHAPPSSASMKAERPERTPMGSPPPISLP